MLPRKPNVYPYLETILVKNSCKNEKRELHLEIELINDGSLLGIVG